MKAILLTAGFGSRLRPITDVLPKCLLPINARPLLEVKPRRVGGATYQIPIEVKSDRGISIAMRWIRDFARQKKGRPMYEKLAEEIISQEAAKINPISSADFGNFNV